MVKSLQKVERTVGPGGFREPAVFTTKFYLSFYGCKDSTTSKVPILNGHVSALYNSRSFLSTMLLRLLTTAVWSFCRWQKWDEETAIQSSSTESLLLISTCREKQNMSNSPWEQNWFQSILMSVAPKPKPRAPTRQLHWVRPKEESTGNSQSSPSVCRGKGQRNFTDG